MKYVTTIDEREYEVEILDESHLRVNGRLYTVDYHAVNDQPVYSLLLDGRSYEAYVYPSDSLWQVLLRGRSFPARVEDEREKLLRVASQGEVGERSEFTLKAPMPGLVISVLVAEGQAIQKGEVLLILESMKMQNELKATRAGTITRVRVQPGETVEQHQGLLTIV